MTLSEREQLEYLRKRIRGITREIFRLFGQRFELARTIGGLKESAGLPTVDSSIENDLRQMVEEESVLMGLDPDVGQRFLTEVFRQTIQAEILMEPLIDPLKNKCPFQSAPCAIFYSPYLTMI